MFELFSQWGGAVLVFAAVVVAAVFPGMGSAKGVGIVGQTAAGLLSEEPSRFIKVLILQALPGTQGLYGFLTAILIMNTSGVLGGDIASITMDMGFKYLLAALPVGVVGYFSAIHQGKTASAGIAIVAKQPEDSTKAIILAVMVETYAVISLLTSLLAVFNVK